MGLFSSSSSSSSEKSSHPPQDSVIKRSSRKICWDSRDVYFACLDKADILDPRKPENKEKAEKLCSKEEADFNKDCISSWVSNNNKFYTYNSNIIMIIFY